MSYRDLRAWITAARERGDVRAVNCASWRKEIGRITESLRQTEDAPAVPSEDIPGRTAHEAAGAPTA